ncbi:MAG: Mrp/NBP35 family ATP-binding protein [Ignavibacteriales bacterium]|nr:Mrp/NBP35 family ATP-binding protein [Ignavibacteriales bacterium]
MASNLAIGLANSGKKIALLELDLYQPKIRHHVQYHTGVE